VGGNEAEKRDLLNSDLFFQQKKYEIDGVCQAITKHNRRINQSAQNIIF
jgi:hypothetical protein